MSHVMLVAPTTIQATLPSSPLAARAAREVIRPLQPDIREDALESLQLILSELVTNGVRHGAHGSPVQLAVTLAGGVIHGEVRNRRESSVPRLRAPDDRLEGGLGLMLLDRLASRWGVSENGEVVVWFDLEAGSGRGLRAG